MYEVDITRLQNCMKRAENGEELTIGFLGGSITQGSVATTPEKTYAYRVFTWWEKTFPNAKFNYVNGGIGGTTSHYGVSRAVTDLLMYQPDFVVMDFSVNDEA
ncbi:MAG: SGNH/GDSL hydrolase family protein, partial [Lachnospiraceae bacterium]|nr:SGNH/GDSL hydrolase family protein [Lachnospiraceae bacterium]